MAAARVAVLSLTCPVESQKKLAPAETGEDAVHHPSC